MTDRSSLFQPTKLGNLELPNRVLMAPLTRNRSQDDGTPVEMAQTYYGQRASAGLIFTEATQVSAMGKGYIKTPASTHRATSTAGRKLSTRSMLTAVVSSFSSGT